MKRLFLLAVALVSVVSWAWAQGNTMTCNGSVIDELGEPVVGATVQAKGTSIAVPTDIDGQFSQSSHFHQGDNNLLYRL